jgi:hypothetical protein
MSGFLGVSGLAVPRKFFKKPIKPRLEMRNHTKSTWKKGWNQEPPKTGFQAVAGPLQRHSSGIAAALFWS